MAEESKQSFQWSGIDNKGERRSGVVQANDMKEAQLELAKMGVEVIDIKQKSQLLALGNAEIFSTKKKITQKDILLLTRYISTMLTAGMPIVQALDIIAKDSENPAVGEMVLSIKNNVASGKTLAESFALYPDQFGDLYCNLINSGEKSGTLEVVLRRLGDYLERSEMLRAKVKKALIYPVAILCVALGVSLVLLVFVVPQFERMFSSFGAELPLFTRMVVSLSEFMRNNWLVLFAGTFLGFMGLKHYMKTSEKAKMAKDKYLLKVYIVGDVLRKGVIARFARTLATTLDAGMPIVDSMKSMSAVMGNRVYSKAIMDICYDVVNGKQLSAAMASTGLFPNMAIQMISVGEASGSLGEMLNKVADYYEDEVNNIVDNLSSLLEPIIMVMLGLIVGGFIVAMYLPIFKIGSLF